MAIERLAHLSGQNCRWRESAADKTAPRRDWRESLLRARITRSSAYTRIEMELPWCLSGPRESVWALAFSNDQFDRQVEEDGAEGASLLDTKVDGGLRVFYQGGGGDDFGGCASVDLANHLY